MNVILLLSVCALVKSEILTDYRVANRPDPKTIVEIIKKIDGTEFYGLLKVPSKASDVGPGTVMGEMKDVARKSELLERTLSASLHKYVYDRLELYCVYAIELVTKSANAANFQKDVVDHIKFDVTELCVVSFIFNMNQLKVDVGFRVMYFLQTIRSDVKPGVLLRQLRQLDRFFKTRSIDVEDADVEQYVTEHSGLRENHSEMSSEQLIAKMSDIRRTVMDLSEKLCSTGVMPVLLKDLLVENPIDTKHPLINFVYTKEMFTPIFYADFVLQSRKLDRTENKGFTKTIEYEHEEYKKYVQGGSLSEHQQTQIAEIIFDYSEKMSVQSFKSGLNVNNYCFNIVQYSVVLSETLFIFVMKEGNKMFKAINDILTKCKSTDFKVNEVQNIYRKLYMFKHFFDHFCSRTFEMFTFASDYIELKFFNNILTKRLEQLEKALKKKDRLLVKESLCSEKALLIFYSSPSVLHGEKPNELYFEEHYISGPIINILKLLINYDRMFYQ